MIPNTKSRSIGWPPARRFCRHSSLTTITIVLRPSCSSTAHRAANTPARVSLTPSRIVRWTGIARFCRKSRTPRVRLATPSSSRVPANWRPRTVILQIPIPNSRAGAFKPALPNRQSGVVGPRAGRKGEIFLAGGGRRNDGRSGGLLRREGSNHDPCQSNELAWSRFRAGAILCRRSTGMGCGNRNRLCVGRCAACLGVLGDFGRHRGRRGSPPSRACS